MILTTANGETGKIAVERYSLANDKSFEQRRKKRIAQTKVEMLSSSLLIRSAYAYPRGNIPECILLLLVTSKQEVEGTVSNLRAGALVVVFQTFRSVK